MEIKAEDYLSQEEITEIIKEEIQTMVKNDKERILTNNSYSLGTAYVESLLTDEDKQFVKDTVKEQLHKKDTIRYELFRTPDAWTKRNFVVEKIMQETIEQNLDIIRAKTLESMQDIDVDKLTEFLTDNFDQVLMTFFKSAGIGAKNA